MLVSSSLHGQNNKKRFSIGGFGGIGVPISPKIFKDYYRLSPNVGVDFMYNFTNYTSVYLNFNFQQFHFNDNKARKEINEMFGESGSVSDIIDGSMELGLTSINLLQYFHSTTRQFRFYILLGGGLTIRKTDNIQIKGSVLNYQYDRTDTLNSETSFGLNGGVGFMLTFSDGIHLFIQGQYYQILSEGFNLWNPEIFTVENTGKRLSFICLIAGLRFVL